MAEGAASAIYQLFARMLEYPTPALPREARKCLELLASGCGTPASAGGENWSPSGRAEAAALVERFCGYVEGTPLAQVEELYTRTFDMQPVCYPYVGHQLFGESYKRSMFMAELNAGYRERGFSAGAELPDHIAVVLRFLASGVEGDFSQGLLNEGLIPALGKMEQAFGESSANPYADVIGALNHLLSAPAGSHEKGVGDA
jgi:nitrate reductase molybdenum cofactor assembly chaperone NarJ/NarW